MALLWSWTFSVQLYVISFKRHCRPTVQSAPLYYVLVSLLKQTRDLHHLIHCKWKSLWHKGYRVGLPLHQLLLYTMLYIVSPWQLWSTDEYAICHKQWCFTSNWGTAQVNWNRAWWRSGHVNVIFSALLEIFLNILTSKCFKTKTIKNTLFNARFWNMISNMCFSSSRVPNNAVNAYSYFMQEFS